MIQRIQSLYLFLTILLAVLFLAGNIFTFGDDTGATYIATLKGVYAANEGTSGGQVHGTVPVIVFVVFTALASVITIFSFRNRKLQSKLAISVIVLAGMLIITSSYCIWFVMSEFQSRLIPGYKMVLPFLMLIFSILAYRGIKKDDNLVKSYDRLR
jgi:hypothetical protein